MTDREKFSYSSLLSRAADHLNQAREFIARAEAIANKNGGIHINPTTEEGRTIERVAAFAAKLDNLREEYYNGEIITF